MGLRLRPLAAAVAAALSLTALSLFTQADEAESRTGEITDVLVTAPDLRDPLTAAHLSREDFSARRPATSDSANLLTTIPGISLYGAGGVSSLPAIHGLGDDRLRIKVDGMDLVSACANHMNPPLSYIDPNSIDSIQVFAGISPVSLGGDSIGGTIAVTSAEPAFSKTADQWLVAGDAGSFYRSNGNGSGASLNLSAANTWLNLRYSGAFAKSGNYHAAEDFKTAGPAAADRRWIDGDEVGSSAYETQNHQLGMAIQRGIHRLDVELGYQHIPYQGFPNQRMDMLENNSTQVNLRYGGDFRWGELESRVYHEHTRHSMNFGDDKQFMYGDAPGMPMETEGYNTGFATTAEIRLSEQDLLRTGVDIQHYQLDDWWPASGSGMMMAPNTFWNIRNGERERYALFGEWQAHWNTQWQTIIGVRHETVATDADDIQGYSMMYNADAQAFNSRDHQRTDHNWDFTAQAQYTHSTTATYEAGFARKTRSPNLYERYTWSTVGMAMRMVNLAGDGNGYVGNLNLEPEIAHTLSVAADWHDAHQQHWQLKVSPFYTLVDDYIDAALCTTMMCNSANQVPGFRYLQFANVDAELYGVDISASRHLGDNRLGSWHLRGLINVLRGKNRTTGDNLYNIMPLNGTLSLEHQQGSWTTALEWQAVSAKEDTSALRNELQTAGYGLLNLRTGVQWHQLRLDLGVENLLDKAYDLPLGGAYVGQGMTMSQTGAPYGIAVPGKGRGFYAGVNYRF